MTTIDAGKVTHVRVTRMNLKAFNAFLALTYTTMTELEQATNGGWGERGTLEAQAELRKELLARLRTAQMSLGDLVRQVENMP